MGFRRFFWLESLDFIFLLASVGVAFTGTCWPSSESPCVITVRDLREEDAAASSAVHSPSWPSCFPQPGLPQMRLGARDGMQSWQWDAVGGPRSPRKFVDDFLDRFGAREGAPGQAEAGELCVPCNDGEQR